MAHFAELDKNNVVLKVIVVDNNDVVKESIKAQHPDLCTKEALRDIKGKKLKIDGKDTDWEDEQKGINFCKKLFGSKWIQTSYNHSFRKCYAGIGYTYDSVNDVFINLQPFPSWKLNKDFDWEAPVKYPTDGKLYMWDESVQKWL